MRRVLGLLAPLLAPLLVLALMAAYAYGQTCSGSNPCITVTPATTLNASPHKLGLNVFSACNFYDADYCDKNYLANGNNVGFEPQHIAQIFAFNSTQASATQFADGVGAAPAGWWNGMTACIILSESNDGNAGECRTISTYSGGTYTLSSGFTTTPVSGDIVEILGDRFPTATGDCSGNTVQPGVCNYTSVSGGATIQGESSNVYQGQQSLDINATSGSATEKISFDQNSSNNGITFNQSLTGSVAIIKVSGTPTVTMSWSRAATNGMNCGPYTLTPTTSWTVQSETCANPGEVDIASGNSNCVAGGTTTACTGVGNVSFNITVSGGEVYIDNATLQNTATGDPANTTPYSDNLFHTVQAYCSGSSLSGVPCVLRWWTGQLPDTFGILSSANAFVEQPASAGYYQSSDAAYVNRNLTGFMQLCQAVGAIPDIALPMMPLVSSTRSFTTDFQNYVQYFGGSSSTTGGAIRAAQGQTAPWTSVFPVIHLAIGNENWNSAAAGQGLPWRSGISANPLQDYEAYLTPVISAMHSASGYASSSFDLVGNLQNVSYSPYISQMAATGIDSMEDNGYTILHASNAGISALDYDQEAEVYNTVANSSDDMNLYQSVHSVQATTGCGSSGTAACGVNIYEASNSPQSCSTDSSPTCPTQTVEDQLTAGAYQGVIDSLHLALLQHAYHLPMLTYFGLEEFANSGAGSTTAKMWGSIVDMRDNYAIGSEPNRGRPQFYSLQLANEATIGKEISCPWTNQPSYSYAGSSDVGVNPPIPAQNPNPYLFALCYENAAATNIAIDIWNVNQGASYTLTFGGGSAAPSGTVTETSFAPSSYTTLNEAPTGSVTNTTAASTVLTTSTLTSFNPTSGVTIPASSEVVLNYPLGSSMIPGPLNVKAVILGQNLVLP